MPNAKQLLYRTEKKAIRGYKKAALKIFCNTYWKTPM